MNHIARVVTLLAFACAACSFETVSPEEASSQGVAPLSVSPSLAGDPSDPTGLVPTPPVEGLFPSEPGDFVANRLVPADVAACLGRHRDCPKLFPNDSTEEYNCHIRASHSVPCRLVDDGNR